MGAYAHRYAPIVSTSFTTFLCLHLPDDSHRLEPAPHLDCYTDEWAATAAYAGLTLTLWGVLAPLTLVFTLRSRRRELRTHEVPLSAPECPWVPLGAPEYP
jgi:hypothetical protein